MANQHDPPFDVEEEGPDSFTREELQNAIQNYDAQRQRFDVAPTTQQMLGPFTVFCLIMNRTIGTGIFTQPVNVLRETGSSGVALAVWCLAGIVILCVVVCWLELGLSVPIYNIFWNGAWTKVSTPRSGGDKNYLEYIFKRPRYLMSCVFGIVFIVFGNLAGNAIQLGIFMMTVVRGCHEEDTCFTRGEVVGWAVSALTLCALINVFTRKYAIGINNILAVLKVLLLLAMAFTGIIYGSVNGNRCQQINWHTKDGTGKFGDIVLALFYAMYPYTGYEQPFYVLAEVSRPKKVFAKATIITMLFTAVLYPLVNVSYLCVTPYNENNPLPSNMALAFFAGLGGSSSSDGRSGPERGVSALLALFTFGNLLAQTYTASRVKQEIAKEGILPWSLFFATGSTSILSRLSSMGRPQMAAVSNIDGHLEQVPIAATLLHWIFEVTLVLAVGLALPPSKSYRFLTHLYTFAVVGVLGLFTAGGLLYLKLDSLVAGTKSRNWRTKAAWKPWLDPLPTVLAVASLSLIVFASFVRPSNVEPGSLPYYVGPTVGWLSVTLGIIWWLGLKYVQWKGRWELHTRRVPYIEIDEDGNYIQKVEFVEHERIPVVG